MVDWFVTESASPGQQWCRVTSTSVWAGRPSQPHTCSHLQFRQLCAVEQFLAEREFPLPTPDKHRYGNRLRRSTHRHSPDGATTSVRPRPRTRPRPDAVRRVRPGTRCNGKPGVFPHQLGAVRRAPAPVGAVRPRVFRKLKTVSRSRASCDIVVHLPTELSPFFIRNWDANDTVNNPHQNLIRRSW